MSAGTDQSKEALFGELLRIAHESANPRRELTKCRVLLSLVQSALSLPELPQAPQADAVLAVVNTILAKARADVLSLKQGKGDLQDEKHARSTAAAGEFLCLTDEEAFLKNFERSDEHGELRLNQDRYGQYQSEVKGKDPAQRGVRAQRAAIWFDRESSRTGERREKDCLTALSEEIDAFLQDPARMAELRQNLGATPMKEVPTQLSRTETTTPRQHDGEQSKPSHQARSNLLQLILISLVLGLAVISLIGFSLLHWGHQSAQGNSTAALCSDIGNRDRDTPEPTWSGPFRVAYQRAGGKAKLGCPRTDDPSGYVHKWGAGWSQDLQDGRFGIARIMALNPQHVIVMAGQFWHDYTDQGNGQPNSNAAQEKGYPTSDPVSCGPARLVMLEQSQESQSPGAMVTDARNGHFIWLPKLVWSLYQTTGGPFGRLGLPLGQEQSTSTGQLQRFQHGFILLAGGVAHTDLQQAGHTEPANRPAVDRFAGCIASTNR